MRHNALASRSRWPVAPSRPTVAELTGGVADEARSERCQVPPVIENFLS